MTHETSNKIEINIALVPEPELAGRQAKISRNLARHLDSFVVLDNTSDRLSVWPHLTLYQAAVPWEELAAIHTDIATIAADEAPHELEATEYALNPDGAFEIRYKNTPPLRRLQNRVISETNPRRHGLLLDKDPGGNPMADQVTHNPHIAATGFAEIEDALRAHSTLAWWDMDHRPVIPEAVLPPCSDLNGTFSAMGIFAMGDHGKCAQLLGSLHPLRGHAH